MRLVTDVFEFCAAELPKWNTISISGYHMREAGATAAQELAFTFAVKSSLRGLPPVGKGSCSRPSQPPVNRLFGGGPGRVVPGTAM